MKLTINANHQHMAAIVAYTGRFPLINARKRGRNDLGPSDTTV